MKDRNSEKAIQERILIIDDDECLAEALKATLEPRYRVTAVNDGLKALELVLTTDYDLIISDMMMPSLSGTDLYREVKRKRPGLEKRILFISGYLDWRLRGFLKETGNLFLSKPFSLMDLLEVVNRFFTTYRLLRCPSELVPLPEGPARAGRPAVRAHSRSSLEEESERGRLREDGGIQFQCPHYERVQGPLSRELVRGYCLGNPAVETMVPSLMEERSYCQKDGGYLECPIYRSNPPREREIDSVYRSTEKGVQ